MIFTRILGGDRDGKEVQGALLQATRKKGGTRGKNFLLEVRGTLSDPSIQFRDGAVGKAGISFITPEVKGDLFSSGTYFFLRGKWRNGGGKKEKTFSFE